MLIEGIVNFMEARGVSIIVPVYNTEEHIDNCLDSIVNQNYTNIEVILIDDGSTDNSSKICDFYSNQDNRIKVIYTSNRGVSCARNIGLEISSGKYIQFIDSDDFLDINMTEVLAKKYI